ncbi:MAG TPA: hypothetical protein VFS15_19745, partial [Kofleriaceae bacterium]|nr:hypothetical protein [Kofleriaceae bacterium]
MAARIDRGIDEASVFAPLLEHLAEAQIEQDQRAIARAHQRQPARRSKAHEIDPAEREAMVDRAIVKAEDEHLSLSL